MEQTYKDNLPKMIESILTNPILQQKKYFDQLFSRTGSKPEYLLSNFQIDNSIFCFADSTLKKLEIPSMMSIKQKELPNISAPRFLQEELSYFFIYSKNGEYYKINLSEKTELKEEKMKRKVDDLSEKDLITPTYWVRFEDKIIHFTKGGPPQKIILESSYFESDTVLLDKIYYLNKNLCVIALFSIPESGGDRRRRRSIPDAERQQLKFKGPSFVYLLVDLRQSRILENYKTTSVMNEIFVLNGRPLLIEIAPHEERSLMNLDLIDISTKKKLCEQFSIPISPSLGKYTKLCTKNESELVLIENFSEVVEVNLKEGKTKITKITDLYTEKRSQITSISYIPQTKSYLSFTENGNLISISPSLQKIASLNRSSFNEALVITDIPNSVLGGKTVNGVVIGKRLYLTEGMKRIIGYILLEKKSHNIQQMIVYLTDEKLFTLEAEGLFVYKRDQKKFDHICFGEKELLIKRKNQEEEFICDKEFYDVDKRNGILSVVINCKIWFVHTETLDKKEIGEGIGLRFLSKKLHLLVKLENKNGKKGEKESLDSREVEEDDQSDDVLGFRIYKYNPEDLQVEKVSEFLNEKKEKTPYLENLYSFFCSTISGEYFYVDSREDNVEQQNSSEGQEENIPTIPISIIFYKLASNKIEISEQFKLELNDEGQEILFNPSAIIQAEIIRVFNFSGKTFHIAEFDPSQEKLKKKEIELEESVLELLAEQDGCETILEWSSSLEQFLLFRNSEKVSFFEKLQHDSSENFSEGFKEFVEENKAEKILGNENFLIKFVMWLSFFENKEYVPALVNALAKYCLEKKFEKSFGFILDLLSYPHHEDLVDGNGIEDWVREALKDDKILERVRNWKQRSS